MIRGFDCITYKDICWFPTQFYLEKMRKENETGKPSADLRKPAMEIPKALKLIFRIGLEKCNGRYGEKRY